jgi:hypothetical protein
LVFWLIFYEAIHDTSCGGQHYTPTPLATTVPRAFFQSKPEIPHAKIGDLFAQKQPHFQKLAVFNQHYGIVTTGFTFL